MSICCRSGSSQRRTVSLHRPCQMDPERERERPLTLFPYALFSEAHAISNASQAAGEGSLEALATGNLLPSCRFKDPDSCSLKMDDDAQKRKTDCVYFLASPLTCKKGNECEYRHSEVARINPRDCRFWLGGNCLNANCAFRHPPLDNRPATTTTPVAPAVAVPKTRVPCYYFFQGFCAKGDKCTYMHGPLPVQGMEAQTLLKPGKQGLVVTSQGNGSLITKPVSVSSQEVPVMSETKPTYQVSTVTNHIKASGSSYEPVAMPSDTAIGIAAECSGSSDPTRPSKRQASPGDESSLKASGKERCQKASRPENQSCPPIQPTDERLCHEQATKDQSRYIQAHRLHQIHSDENRLQNGIESDEFSPMGFDVLVDDGMDQIVYPEETHYSSQHDVTVDSGTGLSRGRKLHSDNLTRYEDDRPGVYDHSRYRDMPSDDYDNGSHDLYHQNPDRLRSYTYHGRKQAVTTIHKAVDGRDKHGTVEEEIRHGIGPTDLRNHILKRRRFAQANRFDGDFHSQRCQQDFLASGSIQGHKSQGYRLRQQDVSVRQKVPLEEDTKFGSRRFVGRAESGVKKRVYHDMQHSGPERISLRRSTIQCTAGDLARAKRLERESRPPSLESLKDMEHTSYNISRRTDSTKDDFDFAGPKSLAQIKAEKRKADADSNLKASDACKPNITEPLVSQSNHLNLLQGSPESSIIGRNKTLSMAVRTESSQALDFEAPRPLTAILREKKKTSEIDQKPEEAGEESAAKKIDIKSSIELSRGSVSSDICSGSLNKDIEDGEVLPDEKVSSPLHVPHQDTDYLQPTEVFSKVENNTEYDIPVRQANALASQEVNRIELTKEMHWNPEGVDPPGEAVDGPKEMHWSPEGVDTPRDIVLEEEGFEIDEDDDDDDDDDDFAKTLGGFFP